HAMRGICCAMARLINSLPQRMLSWSAKPGKREEKAGVVAWRSLRPKLTHHSTRSLGPGGVHLDEDAWRRHAQTTGMGVYG
ncbi:hypothetical protein NL463_30010, partial [Klebsiella pneumoniae]|nr:hypothetical protein [Klebsiella pneumoniae]